MNRTRRRRRPRSIWALRISNYRQTQQLTKFHLSLASVHPITDRPDVSRALTSAPARSACNTAVSSALVAASSRDTDTESRVRVGLQRLEGIANMPQVRVRIRGTEQRGWVGSLDKSPCQVPHLFAYLLREKEKRKKTGMWMASGTECILIFLRVLRKVGQWVHEAAIIVIRILERIVRRPSSL
jgi:hypothetical protein